MSIDGNGERVFIENTGCDFAWMARIWPENAKALPLKLRGKAFVETVSESEKLSSLLFRECGTLHLLPASCDV